MKSDIINVKIKIMWGDSMNKTAACILLIQLLSARDDYVSAKELADILETNPRNIREYIKELEVVGYTVHTLKGIYGGYKLDKSSILPSVKLSSDEKKHIQASVEFLAKSNDFVEFDDYYKAIGKVLSSFERKSDIMPISMIERFPISMDKNQLQLRYHIISDAIESQSKCEIDYLSTKNVVKRHTIHPYKLFLYNGGWFVLAFNESINALGYFKLNRIEAIYETKNHFTIMKTYQEADYLDSFGMKKNGEYYTITLKLKGLNVVINERIYGKNQSVEIIDDNNCILKCDMQNKEMIKTFVLSFGASCEVISPDWLKEDISKELEALIDLYM